MYPGPDGSSDLPPSLATLMLLLCWFPKVSNDLFAFATFEKVSIDPVLVSGLCACGILPLRTRLRLRMLCRSEKIWPACGAAITTVPGLASGGGVGESDLNRGWMCDSLTEVC